MKDIGSYWLIMPQILHLNTLLNRYKTMLRGSDVSPDAPKQEPSAEEDSSLFFNTPFLTLRVLVCIFS